MTGAAPPRDAPQREWIEPQPAPVPPDLAAMVRGHPLVAQTLARRGFTAPSDAAVFLDPNLYEPAPAADLPDLTRAADRIERAILRDEEVLVWGDFDADGQTATALLVSTLRDLGARVRYHIPDRHKESHGVNQPKLAQFVADGIDLLLTCDTGITAHGPIVYAQAQGVDVVVTDHHDLTAGESPAYAAVDPKMLPLGHPLRELPGVGCAYKLAEALYEQRGERGAAAQYLDLVAIGIVADVAVQTRDTRYLLQRGLEVLRRTGRLGLLALMETAQVKPAGLTEEHIGYVLAPRLNALGRMANALVAVEFLTTSDMARARIIASQLEGLNAQRRLACDQVTKAAEALIARDPSLLDDPVLVLSHPAWPAGVIGIVAGRLAERYNRPTILIATPVGEPGRGSARSVEGCSIIEALSSHSEMLMRFGGHPMAAGLTIEPDRILGFRRALSRTVLEQCGERPPASPLQIDAYVDLSGLSLELARELRRLAPFGPGNPRVVLAARQLRLRRADRVGRSGAHFRLAVEDAAGTRHEVMWWQGAGLPLPEGRFDLAYTIRASNYRGHPEAQLEWVDARVNEPTVEARRIVTPTVQVQDHRLADSPDRVLAALREQGNLEVWAEAEHRSEIGGKDRYELGRSDSIAIWTIPPGRRELLAAIKRVAPTVIHLFATDPGMATPAKFLERLAGLLKRILRHGPAATAHTHISELAAATAQREETVRAGLAWMDARGIIRAHVAGDEVVLSAGDKEPGAGPSAATASLEALLRETTAYRAHFVRAAGDNLLALEP